MNRRQFLFASGAACVPMARPAAANPPGKKTIYFVDGWHGGVKGHMPSGAWRDILRFLDRTPEWKVTLEIEPDSWNALRAQDPQAFEELRRYLADPQPAARVELIGTGYAQSLAWAFSGESLIRQLLSSKRIVERQLPGAKTDTYANQEPCWTAAMPQILRSLGFERAVLKNSTTTIGYSTGVDAEMVDWIGPDGASIPAVPRYACEAGLHPFHIESNRPTEALVDKFIEHGIQRPSGMWFQDLGWEAKKATDLPIAQFVTWREYCEQIAAKPRKPWRFNQENIRVTLPWGEKDLHRLSREARSAENRILVAEKLAALAAVLRGVPYPAERLAKAWENVMLSQHHDCWIVAKGGRGRRSWSWRVGSWTFAAENVCDEVVANSAAALAGTTAAPVQKPLGPQWAVVLNTLGSERDDLVELPVAADPGCRSVRVSNAAGQPVLSQVLRTRSYPGDKSLGAATVLFRAEAPPLGFTSYRIEPVYRAGSDSPPAGAGARVESDQSVVVETDHYRIRLDPARGGGITSLYGKLLRKEFCDPAGKRLLNEYRGFFIKEGQWASSADKPAKVRIVENGPLRVRLLIEGEVLGRAYRTTLTVAQGQRRIDFTASFDFGQETWIGDPFWSLGYHWGSQRRSHHNDEYKLQAMFPVALSKQVVYKNSAYDVCRSENADTFYTRWDAIKHNIIVNWVDVVDGDEQHGLALLADRTGSYAHGENWPLSLVLAWGYVGTYYRGECPLSGEHESSYSLAPHAGRWDSAHLSRESMAWQEPLLAQLSPTQPGQPAHSLVRPSGSGFEIPAVLVEGKDLLVRLFNAEGDGSPCTISFGRRPAQVDLIELDGRRIQELAVRPGGAGEESSVSLAIPRFGIRTLRLRGVI